MNIQLGELMVLNTRLNILMTYMVDNSVFGLHMLSVLRVRLCSHVDKTSADAWCYVHSICLLYTSRCV